MNQDLTPEEQLDYWRNLALELLRDNEALRKELRLYNRFTDLLFDEIDDARTRNKAEADALDDEEVHAMQQEKGDA